MLKRLLASVILVCISNIAAATIKVINFATDIPYPPFEVQTASGDFQGFDIDIASAICQQLHAQCIFHNEPFGNLLSSLKTNKYDAWISAISITPERKKEIAFSDAYFTNSAKLIAPRATIFNARPIEIAGRTIGVKEGTCYIPYLEATYGDIIHVKKFSDTDELYKALKSGTIDAVIDDAAVVQKWRAMQGAKNYRLIDLPARYAAMLWQDYGIAVNKNNTELLRAINHALGKIRSDETYHKIKARYFLE